MSTHQLLANYILKLGKTMNEITHHQPHIPNQLPVQEQERPERLSDEQLDNLLTAVGNHEGKALLLLAMQPEVYYAASALHGLITNLPGSENAYTGSRNNQLQYCKASLAPIGLVAKTDYGVPISFAITETGEELGKPLAALMLGLSNKYNISLTRIIGEAQTPTDKRAPSTRLSLIKEVLKRPNISLQDTAKMIGLERPAVVHSHLVNMASSGLIHYEWMDRTKQAATFELIDPMPKIDPQASPQRRELTQYLIEKKQATLDELTKHLARSNEEIKPHAITSILHHLAKKGVIKRIGGVSPNQQAKIIVDEKQRQMLQELVHLLDLYQSQDPQFLAALRAAASEYSSNAKFVAEALNRCAEASSKMKNGREKDMGSLVVNALINSDSALSVRDISGQIKTATGRAVSLSGIQQTLYEFAKRGQVEYSETRKARLYKLQTEKQEQKVLA